MLLATSSFLLLVMPLLLVAMPLLAFRLVEVSDGFV